MGMVIPQTLACRKLLSSRLRPYAPTICAMASHDAVCDVPLVGRNRGSEGATLGLALGLALWSMSVRTSHQTASDVARARDAGSPQTHHIASRDGEMIAPSGPCNVHRAFNI